MPDTIQVRSWFRATEVDERLGVLGYVSIAVGDLVIDGVVLRRTEAGRLTLAFPKKTARTGERYSIVRPADEKARSWIELAVLRQLAARGNLPEAWEVEP